LKRPRGSDEHFTRLRRCSPDELGSAGTAKKKLINRQCCHIEYPPHLRTEIGIAIGMGTWMGIWNLELWLTSWLPAGQHSSSSLSLSSAAEIELPGKKTWGGPSQTGTDTMQKAETSGRQQIHLFE